MGCQNFAGHNNNNHKWSLFPQITLKICNVIEKNEVSCRTAL